MDASRAPRSARWGTACGPCAMARLRCVRNKPPFTECDRCQSLEVPCVAQIRKPRKKRQTKVLRTSQLEDKLANLIDSLKTLESIEQANLPDRFSSNLSARSSIITKGTFPNTQADGESHCKSTPNPCTCNYSESPNSTVSSESDEALLSIYMDQLTKNFPFAILPAGTTSKQLQETRPFLLKAIRVVASVRNFPSMRDLTHAILRDISEAVLIRSERSLDLLQGILVLSGFYHNHCMTHAQFNNLNHLAVSLVEDMGLTTRLESQHRQSQLPLIRRGKSRPQTNEELRAVIGVWYMKSNASLVNRQLSQTRYTKCLEDCLTTLSDAAEYDIDKLVVQMVRIQNSVEKVLQFHNYYEEDDDRTRTDKVSVVSRLEMVKLDMERLQTEVVTNFKDNYSLSCYVASVHLRLFQPFLAGAHLPDEDPDSIAAIELSGISVLDIFTSFTNALSKWFDNWLAIPVCSYFYMSQPFCAQLIHASMMLYHWVRVVGSNVLKISSTGSAVPNEVPSMPRQDIPAFSGFMACPDMGSLHPPSSLPGSEVSTQVLRRIRAEVLANVDLQLDIFGILDSMIARFEISKTEIAAARGGTWNNDTWDLAADHIKIKRARAKKWCNKIASSIVEDMNRRLDDANTDLEQSSDSMTISEDYKPSDLGWAQSEYGQCSMQWEMELFDEFIKDADPNPLFDPSSFWGTDKIDL